MNIIRADKSKKQGTPTHRGGDMFLFALSSYTTVKGSRLIFVVRFVHV